MRAWEFINESAATKLSVGQMNDLKRQEREREASRQRRIERTRPMYANTVWQREQLELERMRLELEQIRAETEAIKAEPRTANDDAISELAQSGVEAKHCNERRVHQLARAEINRHK